MRGRFLGIGGFAPADSVLAEAGASCPLYGRVEKPYFIGISGIDGPRLSLSRFRLAKFKAAFSP